MRGMKAEPAPRPHLRAIVAMLVAVAVCAGLAALARFVLPDVMLRHARDPIWAGQRIVPLCLFVPMALIALVAMQKGRARGLFKAMLRGAVMGFGCAGLAAAGHWMLGGMPPVSGPLAIEPMIFAMWIGLILIEAVALELFFRGWLQPVLIGSVLPLVAILSGAILFGLFLFAVRGHMPLFTINMVFLGIALGLVRHLAGSVLASAAMLFAWRLTLGPLLGLSPGVEGSPALFGMSVGPAKAFAGGVDGLDAGVVVTGVLIAVVVALAGALLSRRRSHEGAAPLPFVAAEEAPYTIISLPDRDDGEDDSVTIASPAPPVLEVTQVGPRSDADNSPLAAVAQEEGDIAAGMLTHEGRVRPANEDSIFGDAGRGLWVVADGMGGHIGGAWASTQIVEALSDLQFGAVPLDERFGVVLDALRSANRAIHARGEQLGQRIGSTLVSLLIHDGAYAVLWVGDSRVYRMRDGRMEQLTRDHSQVESLIEQGLLAREDAASHPLSHVLTRAVGVRPEVAFDHVAAKLKPGDRFLLCSDGLSGVVPEEEMAAIVAAHPVDQAAGRLIAAALDRHAPDNVSAIVVAAGVESDAAGEKERLS